MPLRQFILNPAALVVFKPVCRFHSPWAGQATFMIERPNSSPSLRVTEAVTDSEMPVRRHWQLQRHRSSLKLNLSRSHWHWQPPQHRRDVRSGTHWGPSPCSSLRLRLGYLAAVLLPGPGYSQYPPP